MNKKKIEACAKAAFEDICYPSKWTNVTEETKDRWIRDVTECLAGGNNDWSPCLTARACASAWDAAIDAAVDAMSENWDHDSPGGVLFPLK